MNVLSLFDGISCGQIALERAGIKYDKYFASEIDKYAIQITQKNYPNTIQLGDVKGLQYENGALFHHQNDNPMENGGSYITDIDLLIGGSPCFVAGTKVITDKYYKNIEEIKVGDKVLTHKGLYKKVLATGKKLSETIIVKAQGIKPTETTSEHPYYVRKMTRKWDNSIRRYVRVFSEPIWVKVSKLSKGDFIGININTKSENPLNLTEEECYVLGRYIADGHTRKDYRTSKNRSKNRNWALILSIGEHKVKNFCKHISENHYSCYKHTKSVYRVIFSNKRLVNIAEKYCGIGAINKKIPQLFINLPNNLLEKVIDGYMSGDGSCRKGVYRASSISEELILTLSQAIAKVYRVNSNYEYTKTPDTHIIEGRTVKQHDIYTITFRKEMRKQSHAKVIDNIIWLPVKGVYKINKVKEVYNLEVEDDNSYTANNAIVHNCQGFSFSGKQLNFNDPRSKLFFEFARLLEETKPKYFLLENVRMKKEYQDVISKHLGVEPIMINSSLVSAQNRKRLYWTNIPNVTQPEDKRILLKDILENVVDDKYIVKGNCLDWWIKNGELRLKKKYSSLNADKTITMVARQYANWNGNYVTCSRAGDIGKGGQGERVYGIKAKSVTLSALGGGRGAKTGLYLDKNLCIRKLTPIECERLQTISDNYTEGVSDSQRYKMLGNGWTVDVIAHILKNIGDAGK